MRVAHVHLAFGFATTMLMPSAIAQPQIMSHPQSLTLYRGETASFNVAASGVAPLAYRWLKGGAILNGASSATLLLTNVRSANAGSYQAAVTDGAGNIVTSAVATLTVVDPTATATNAVTLTPAMDTSIQSSGVNPQGGISILAGTRLNGILDRGLLRFDFSSVPAGSVLQSARLRLIIYRLPRRPAHSDFSLYRMFKSWGNDATWTNAMAEMPWSVPGGQAGTDYSATPSVTQLITDKYTEFGPYYFGPSGQMIADIEGWLANPASNYGWMLKCDREDLLATARHYASSENQPILRPELFLQYIHPAAPRLTNVVAEAGNLRFRFNAADGWLYRIESRDDFASGSWNTVTNFPAGPPRTISVSLRITTPARLCRVIAE